MQPHDKKNLFGELPKSSLQGNKSNPFMSNNSNPFKTPANSADQQKQKSTDALNKDSSQVAKNTENKSLFQLNPVLPSGQSAKKQLQKVVDQPPSKNILSPFAKYEGKKDENKDIKQASQKSILPIISTEKKSQKLESSNLPKQKDKGLFSNDLFQNIFKNSEKSLYSGSQFKAKQSIEKKDEMKKETDITSKKYQNDQVQSFKSGVNFQFNSQGPNLGLFSNLNTHKASKPALEATNKEQPILNVDEPSKEGVKNINSFQIPRNNKNQSFQKKNSEYLSTPMFKPINEKNLSQQNTPLKHTISFDRQQPAKNQGFNKKDIIFNQQPLAGADPINPYQKEQRMKQRQPGQRNLKEETQNKSTPQPQPPFSQFSYNPMGRDNKQDKQKLQAKEKQKQMENQKAKEKTPVILQPSLFTNFNNKSGPSKQSKPQMSFSNPTNTLNTSNLVQDYFELSELEIILKSQYQSKDQLRKRKQNRTKIANSFKIYLSLLQNSEDIQKIASVKMNENIGANEGMNKLLNDFAKFIIVKLQISKQSYQPFGQLFYDMLTNFNLDQKLFQGSQIILDTVLLLKIYRLNNNDRNQLIFNPDEKQTINLLIQFTNYYLNKLIECLQMIKKMPDFLVEYKMIQFLFEKLLVLGKRNPDTQIAGLYSFLKQTNVKLIYLIQDIIMQWIRHKKIEKAITPEKLKSLIKQIDNLPQGQVSGIVQKVILQMIFPEKGAKTELFKYFQDTQNPALLPFKVLTSIDKKYTYQLSKIVKGSHWLNWMEEYLKNNQQYSEEKSTNNIMKSLQSFKDDEVKPIIYKNNPNIFYFIDNLRSYNNSVTNFYKALSIIATQKSSIEDIEKNLFKGQNTIIRQLRPFINEIKNYPNCQFIEEDLKEIQQKASFYLTILKVQTDKAFEFQNAFFDIHGFSNERSNRCDRVCHSLLDILGFFCNNLFCEQILINALEAIIALLESDETKVSMSLAMNINRPDLSFLNRNLNQKCMQKFGKFLTYILNTKQFYDSVRAPDMSLESSRAYSVRYNIQKYLLITTQHKATVPVYWFAHGLKVLTKFGYNPKLLYTILLKLLIVPSSQIYSSEKPYILESIADVCDSEIFWNDFIETFETQSFIFKRKIVLQNKIIQDEFNNSLSKNKTKQEPLLKVFYSLKLLKTLFQLDWITNIGQKNSPKHFITMILSNLKCIKDAERYFINGSEISSYRKNSNYQVSPIVSLIALLKYRNIKYNYSKESVQKQWTYVDSGNFSAEKLIHVYKEIKNNVDYYIVRDNLIHPNNKYLQNNDSIASIAFDCLTNIVKNACQTNVEAALYGSISQSHSQIELTDWKKLIIADIVTGLGSKDLVLSVNAWHFLLSLRQTYLNSRFASQIFEVYILAFPTLSQSPSVNLLIAKYILNEYRSGNFCHYKQVTSLIESLNKQSTIKKESYNLDRLCNMYYKKIFPIGISLHEFERIVVERQITFATQIYQEVGILTQITLRQFYERRIEAQIHARKLTCFIADHKLLSMTKSSSVNLKPIISQKNQENDNDSTYDQIDEETKEKQRTYEEALKFEGLDPLNIYLCQKDQTRQNISRIQKNNVLNYATMRKTALVNNLRQFYSVMLSIDDTFYANHSIQIASRQFSGLFCQLHLGTLPIKADSLLGDNVQDSVVNAKKCLEDCLQKIEKLRRDGLSDEMIELFGLIDLFLNWLNKNYKRISENQTMSNRNKRNKHDEMLSQINRVTSICFTLLGQQIIHPVPAKLLLTLVTIGGDRLSPEIIKSVKTTITRTLQSQQALSEDVKQFMLPLLIVLPPKNCQMHLVNLIIKMWTNTDQNQYFYNISRTLLKISQIHPIEVCKTKLLTKNLRMVSLISEEHIYYNNGLRTPQSMCWLWILKIVTCLAKSLANSSIIIYQISEFVKKHKNKILLTLNDPRNQIFGSQKNSVNKFRSNSSGNKKNEGTLQISLAKLDELESTLQLLTCLFQCDMWIIINREIFQEFVYTLMHRNIFMFVGYSGSIMGIKVLKKYIPFSDCEKVMWDMDLKSGMIKNQYKGIYQPINQNAMDEEISLNMVENVNHNPSAFMLLMTIRFQDCAKVWLTACSFGMKSSYFTQQYFKNPICIDNKGNQIRYSMTHWQHLNKAINQIVIQDLSRIEKWGNWNKLSNLLIMIKDCYQSAQMFLELGYLNTIVNIPENPEQLLRSLSVNISLTLQMATYHLLSQIQFKRKNGTLITSNLKRFQQKMSQLSILAEKNFSKLCQDQEIRENISFGRVILENVEIV